MRLFAISRIGNNKSCDFFDEYNSILFHTETEKLKDSQANTHMFNEKNQLLFTINYLYSKIKAKKFLCLKKGSGCNFEVVLNDKGDLVCDELEILLHRSWFNKKLKLYCKNKLISCVNCKTLLRQWLQGKYSIDILDKDKVELILCMIVIAFIVISDEYICTVRNSF